MKLKKHNRYAYSPITGRQDFTWPDGKRIALYCALNVEHFSFGEGLGHTPTTPGPQPDVRNFGWRDYGLRVGDRKSTRLNSSHPSKSRMPSSA